MDILPEIKTLLDRLQAKELYGRPLSEIDRLSILRQIYEICPIGSLEPILPILLSFKKQPLSLRDYQPMAPLFRTDRPHRLTYKCSRQVGKSLSLASGGLLTAATIPNFNMLFVTPLGDQIKRFSVNYVKPLIETSPFKSFFANERTAQTMQQRTLPNGSILHFSFASTSADRIRGINADFVGFDEIQDFNPDNLSVIEATCAASKYEYFQYTGTPKTLDNTLQGLWLQSSMAEWWVKCPHCGEWNIPSLEYHLEEMIGPYHDDISDENPGTICHKCRKPINPRFGMWVHRYPERKATHAGYHVPTIILPLHFADPKKWASLLEKQNGAGHTSRAKFCNEILGEAFDEGQKLVSMTDLQAAGSLEWSNNPDDPDPAVFDRLRMYPLTCLAADWAGGGEKLISFTVLALLGMKPDGSIDCLWGKRFTASLDHRHEAEECLYWFKKFNVNMFVHDYTGAGVLRESILHDAGIPMDRIIPIQYVRSAKHSIINYVPATPQHARDHYTADKTRSLLYTVDSLKTRRLKFFRYDGSLGSTEKKSEEEKMSAPSSLMNDFLALVEEKVASASGADNYVISRSALASDDFAQAVNIGCLALWHASGNWPNFADGLPDMYEKVQSYDEDLEFRGAIGY